jgi:hypothetical protein
MIRVAWIALAIGCHGSPAPTTTAPPAGSSSEGNGSTGSFGSATSTGSATTAAECPAKRCGPTLGMMSKQCSDGSIGGPTGRCLEQADKTCAWEIRACP